MSKQATDLATVWQSLAHKVIASVLVDSGAVFPVLDTLGRGLHWFPPQTAPV